MGFIYDLRINSKRTGRLFELSFELWFDPFCGNTPRSLLRGSLRTEAGDRLNAIFPPRNRPPGSLLGLQVGHHLSQSGDRGIVEQHAERQGRLELVANS